MLIQILWNGRWIDGAAAGSGEEVEQLFSYLSRFNLTTKHMNAAGMFNKLIHGYKHTITSTLYNDQDVKST